ncbi:P-loop NTPase fold protein [Maribellus sp. YY47]|uniref:KAP family P-loop NTPase fold protein n=1 Tax=Maribellus sp. YY47 TaxID=2929486 RepID=UPI00200116B5|nr:P-loop NTPase fold protein [Maribellus sp. YY47]MCK3685984.1 KAP family NTPase [Maribellus sp. YY47]
MNETNLPPEKEKSKIDFWKRLILTISVFNACLIIGHLLFEILFSKNSSVLATIVDYNYHSREVWIISFNIFVLLYLVFKSIEKNTFPNRSKFLTDLTVVLFVIWYCFKRGGTHEINGVSFCLDSYSFVNIKYLDFLILLGIFSIIRLSSDFISKSKKIEHKSVWMNDKPLANIEFEDFGRKELVNKVVGEINSFSDQESSFTIGIVGPWGSGKTSFIKILQDKVNTDQNIIIDFNPWQYPEETNLTLVFLKEIEKHLCRYSFSTNRINDYLNQLFKGNINWWGTLTNLFIKEKNIRDVQESIKESILEARKKLIVFIDDIDRLQANEIYEVLTIIRNIGNLPNTIFVLGYDKDYLLDILEDKIKHPQRYLSKFFQVEFSLSKIADLKVREELTSKLEISFPEFQKDYVASSNEEEFESADALLQSIEIVKLLKNKRDVIKLMNVINTTWPILREALVLRIYLQLEILRLKYGNIYSKLKFRDKDFLFENESAKLYVFNTNVDLDIIIKNSNDRDIIRSTLESMFPNNGRERNLKSIRRVEKFDSYFQNQLTTSAYEELEALRGNEE